MLETVQDTR